MHLADHCINTKVISLFNFKVCSKTCGKYHWSSTESYNDSRWNECVKRRPELSYDISRIAKLTEDQSPFAFNSFDHPGWDKHARHNQSTVNGRRRCRSQTCFAVD